MSKYHVFILFIFISQFKRKIPNDNFLFYLCNNFCIDGLFYFEHIIQYKTQIAITFSQLTESPKSKILVFKYSARLQREIIFFGIYVLNFNPYTHRKKLMMLTYKMDEQLGLEITRNLFKVNRVLPCLKIQFSLLEQAKKPVYFIL